MAIFCHRTIDWRMKRSSRLQSSALAKPDFVLDHPARLAQGVVEKSINATQSSLYLRAVRRSEWRLTSDTRSTSEYPTGPLTVMCDHIWKPL